MVKLEDRPIEQVREEVIDKLIYHYSHGVISAEAFERRPDNAMASQDHQEIAELAADLTMQVDDDYTRQKDKKLNINYTAGETPDNETIFNIMGGSDIDFSDAVFTTPNVTIKTLCIMGGTDIKVPENVNVVTKAFCLMGSIENNAPSIAERQAPTITVEGFVLLGGVDIGFKRTIKEKFVELAAQMKALFGSAPR